MSQAVKNKITVLQSHLNILKIRLKGWLFFRLSFLFGTRKSLTVKAHGVLSTSLLRTDIQYLFSLMYTFNTIFVCSLESKIGFRK